MIAVLLPTSTQFANTAWWMGIVLGLTFVLCLISLMAGRLMAVVSARYPPLQSVFPPDEPLVDDYTPLASAVRVERPLWGDSTFPRCTIDELCVGELLVTSVSDGTEMQTFKRGEWTCGTVYDHDGNILFSITAGRAA